MKKLIQKFIARFIYTRRDTQHAIRNTQHAIRNTQQGITHHASGFTSQNGLSLVSTLWIITILSLLATQFLRSIILEQKAQTNFADRTKFYYAARAGFEQSVAILRGDQTPYDALGENWTEEIEQQIEDGMRPGTMLTYRVTIADEGSKINMNTAEADVIQGLLDLIGYEDTGVAEQPLAQAIVQSRPYRTVRDLARVDGMTQELLFGQQQTTPLLEETEDEDEEQNAPGLINYVTVYSIDKNTDANGQQRVNINTADAQQLTQIQGNNNQSVFTQGEAESLIQQRGQSGQGGQNGQGNQGGQPGQGEANNENQNQFDSIGALIDVRAISQETFNNIRDRISVDSGDENQEIVNINNADSERLQTLDGVDQGIAERIINHRDNQGNFNNVDEVREVRLLTTDEFKSIVDKITISDDETLNGLININTASQEILQLLPGMDEQKAQAIITRRESEPQDNTQNLGEAEVEGNPFTNIGQLLDVEGIDTNTFQQIAGLVTYRSHGFIIEATGIDSRGRTIASCTGAIDRTGEQIAIKYWRQD